MSMRHRVLRTTSRIRIHWNESTRTVIYRSRKHWRTKRNFEVFPVSDFLAAAVQHIPPKGQQTLTKEWIPVENPEDDPGWFDQSNRWQGPEVPLDNDRILVLDFTDSGFGTPAPKIPRRCQKFAWHSGPEGYPRR